MTNINIDNTNAVETKYIPTDGKHFIELIPENIVRRSDTLYLYFIVIVGVIPSFTVGACMGWLSPVMVKLESNDTRTNPLGRPITTFEVSLCFAIPGILSIIGTSILPKIGDTFGRKHTPESPVYLLTKGEKQRCIKTLKKLRNNKTAEELNSDFNDISRTLILDDKMKEASMVRLFSSKECRMGLILGSLPSIVQIFCGVPIIMSLLAPIFNQSGSNLSGDTIAIIVALVKTVSFGFTSFVVEKTGRRKLLIASSVGMGSAISVLGIFFYLNSIKSLMILQFKWVPLVGALVYIVSYSIGVGTLPLVIIGELFVSELRTSAFSFIMAVCGILYTIYSAAYPLAAEMIGVHWCMCIFGAASFIGGLLIYKYLPETKGKSILEIQNLLKQY